VPTGNVSFYDGTNLLGTVALTPGSTNSTATYSTSALAGGTHSIIINYGGDSNYSLVNSLASTSIQVNSTGLSLVLSSSTLSTVSGAVVTFQVQAGGATLPAGQIVTLTGLPTVATVAPTFNLAGLASYSYGLFPPGTYTIQASYAGSDAVGPGTSNTISLQVASTPVTVTLASSANPVNYPTPINLTANVTSDGLGIPTGTITFINTDIVVGSGTLATANGSSGLASVGTIDAVTGQTVVAVVTGYFHKESIPGSIPDIATLEVGPDAGTLLISVGNGDGTFQAPVTYGASANIDPTSVSMAAADFNGDGCTDLVIAASDGNVLVLLAACDAAGDMTFSQLLNVPGAVAVATGDFDGSGNQGFAAINADSVTAFYGTGSTPTNFPSLGSWNSVSETANYTGITVANFDGGSRSEIALSDNNGPDAAVFLYNAEAGRLTGPQTYPVGASATAIASGDINGDGYPDLAVVSNIDSTVYTLINGGVGQNGNFVAGASYGVASQPAAITMNDFNHDGYADIAVAGTGTVQGGGTTILLGSSTGAMTGETSLPATYGQAIASADFNGDGNPDLAVGLNGVATFLDSAAQISADNLVFPVGTSSLTALYTPSSSSVYARTTSNTVNEVVNQGTPIITWSNPANITYGKALSTTQLDATASVSGAFTYTPAAGTILTAGTHSLSVTFVPSVPTDYQDVTATVSITVNQATTTITWALPAAITYGTPLSATQLNATDTVQGTFTYTPAIGAILGAGQQVLEVAFTPKDSADYLGSGDSVAITVNQATPAISWANPASITYGTALGSTQLDATATPPGGTFAYTPASGMVLTAGSHTLSVTLTPADTTDYATATATVTLMVSKATLTVTAGNASRAYDTANPTFTDTITGFVNGDTQDVVSGAASLTTTATLTSPVGTYPITAAQGTLSASNYTFTFVNGTLTVSQATPVISWGTPAAITYGTALGSTQLDATATPPGGAFAYTPAAGTVLAVGAQTLSVKYTPPDTADYTTASASVTIQVAAGLGLASIQPTSGVYGSAATTITLTGTGFTANSIVELNGAAIASKYVGLTQMTAVIPASFFQQTQPGAITVTNPAAEFTTPPIAFTVTLPNIQISFSGPSSESPGQQPSLDLTFLEGFPQPLQVTLTLTVQPATPGGPVDPAVQFSTGGTTFSFTEPANSTTVPTIQIQTGTLAATITVTLTLESGGQDVTPSGLQPVVISVPATAPVITSVSLTRDGAILIVVVQGYSSPRDMTSAIFNFTAASGDSINDPQVTVDVGTDFIDWYAEDTSTLYGSAFTYTQTFLLSNDASTIGSVSVTLSNSIGTSNAVSAR
jgi:hypothetical protein